MRYWSGGAQRGGLSDSSFQHDGSLIVRPVDAAARISNSAEPLSLVEHLLWDQEVVGSNPAAPIRDNSPRCYSGRLRRILNVRVCRPFVIK